MAANIIPLRGDPRAQAKAYQRAVLKQQLERSLEIERLEPVTVKVRPLNEEIWSLHQRSAAGLTTPEEEARLTAWCEAREAEAGE
jgi:hypothetical protein